MQGTWVWSPVWADPLSWEWLNTCTTTRESPNAAAKTQHGQKQENKQIFKKKTKQISARGCSPNTLFWITQRREQRSFNSGTSSEVQWLRLHASTAGGKGSIPGQGAKIPHAVGSSQQMKTSFSSACDKVSILWDRGFQTCVGEWAALEVVLNLLYMKLFNSDWNLSPCAGILTQTKPSLRLEPMIF